MWGVDAYAWSTLTKSWSYGNRGGTTSREGEFGGGEGGRLKIIVKNISNVNGSISAKGGDGGLKGGGGSGGSIILHVPKLQVHSIFFMPELGFPKAIFYVCIFLVLS